MTGPTYDRRCAPALLAAFALALPACDAGGTTEPVEDAPVVGRVAFVVQEGPRPALYVQNADGTGRARIHFAGARELPGNSPAVPPVRDENILAIGPVAWSPDGTRLAAVLTLAYDQSELVVVNADGSDARVASLNFQIIMTAPDWSPDGSKLAYGMSTLATGRGVQLFVTDLAAESWRQVTGGDPVGSAGTDVRWSTDGATIYLWRTLGQSPPPADEWISRISAVNATTGATLVLQDSIAGMVHDVARDGTWALVIRDVARPAGLDAVRDLVRRPLVGSGPESKLAEGNLLWARASANDRGVTVVADEDSAPGNSSFSVWVIPSGGGRATTLAGLDRSAYVLDVFVQ